VKAGVTFCSEDLLFLRQTKKPIPRARTTPIIAAPTAMPAITPVERECVLDDERDWAAPPAVEEEVAAGC
jgi:hypothetical protein